MRDVAVVSFAQSKSVRDEDANEVEILMPVVSEAIEQSGVPRKQIGFTMSGSCDYLAGVPFAFVSGLDAVGAWPPIRESHVEMDGAWALYEAWVKLQTGEVDSALVYGFGKSSMGSLRDVLAVQLDPYYVAPLWPDAISLAALQARAVLDGTEHTEREMAEVAARSRRDARDNPYAVVTGEGDVDAGAVNPSGGALCANPLMATGLIRFGEVAARIHRGEAGRGLAHATSGPCLQQNLVAVLEADA